MHPDQASYLPFTSRARMDKAINSLLGIMAGIAIDAKINEAEITLLADWLDEHDEYKGVHPSIQRTHASRDGSDQGWHLDRRGTTRSRMALQESPFHRLL